MKIDDYTIQLDELMNNEKLTDHYFREHVEVNEDKWYQWYAVEITEQSFEYPTYIEINIDGETIRKNIDMIMEI